MRRLGVVQVSIFVLAGLLGSVMPLASMLQSAAASAKTLSAAQQHVLMNLMAIHGHEIALSSRVTAALGITKGDEVLTLRQLTTLTGSEPPLRHAYTPLPGGGVMLILRDGKIPSSYRLDANLKLIAAVSMVGKELIVIPIPDAERTVQTELAYWAAVADNP